MTHAPLLNIDRLRSKRPQAPLSDAEWKSIWGDMNSAVCILLRLQERGAFRGHTSLGEEVRRFLDSKDDVQSPLVTEAELPSCPACGKKLEVRAYGPFFRPNPSYNYALSCSEMHWRGRMCDTREEAIQS